MERTRLSYLHEWLVSGKARKPLIIRGARQVGKTWLVRHFAKTCGKQLIEINLEKQVQLATLFSTNNPKQILLNLEATFNQTISPDECLLFIDEIQAAPEILAKLRWFAEDMPQLPIIAAGSLLEFILAKHSFSMPVGRISYMYLEPLSFEEFLLAMGKKILYEYLVKYSCDIEIPIAIHNQLTDLLKEYTIIGGLPAAVLSWVTERSLQNSNKIHHDLLSTYKDDFAKYRGRLPLERLHEVINATPQCLGQKFVYSKVNAQMNANTIKQALMLLSRAKICTRVVSSAANGVPLAAEINEKYFKVLFLDVGLTCSALGLSLTQLTSLDELILINKGAVAEQIVGQLLRTIYPAYVEPSLYYWQREEKGSNAEIDYIIQHENNIIPIEVKAGSTGTLKSLHLFMELKKRTQAIRINSAPPSKTDVKIKDHAGNIIEYTLLSLPFYLIGQLHRLLP